MIGIVIVSHSALLAEGLQQLLEQMHQGRVPVAVAGGTANPEAPIGTDPAKVLAAIEAVYNDDGVIVLMDLGSAIMSAETALEWLTPEQCTNVFLCEAPLVEGAFSAAVTAANGGTIEAVFAEARGAIAAKSAQLATTLLPDIAGASATHQLATHDTLTLTIVVPNKLGIHARPAARLVSLANQFDAKIELAHAGNSAVATSMNQVATLGVRQGDVLVVHASGPQAGDALAAIEMLALDNFGDPIAVTEPTEIIAAAMEDVTGDTLVGIPAAGGIAFGPAVLYRPEAITVAERTTADPDAERTRLEVAIAAVASHLAYLRNEMFQRAGAGEAGIFDAQLFMVQDADLQQTAIQAIELRHLDASSAWLQAMNATAARYRALDDPYLARRADDLVDVGQRVLRLLEGLELDPAPPKIERPSILVAYDLKPSDVVRLPAESVLGIVTERGGVAGHTAILARALSIPCVAGVSALAGRITTDQVIALDGEAGHVWLAPDATLLATLEARQMRWQADREAAQHEAQQPAITTDNRRIEIGANINGPSDIPHALAQGAEGVGVFRTEFLYMDRPAPPSEEEQLEVYRAAAQQLGEHPLIVRTLDVGGDKPLSYLRTVPEANPFLGQRGLRYCLEHPGIFKPQLRAILRTAADHPVLLMFPMVSSWDELVLVDALIDEVCAELQNEGLAFDEDIARGIMIETPSAVFVADQLARLVDFFSIGTNDLSQYVMAADRGNGAVADLVSPFQPAVLRAIKHVIDAGHEAGIWVGICGEVGGDPRASALLVGLGADELSMSAPSIPAVKAQIRAISLAEATALADEVLAMESATLIEEHLTQYTQQAGIA